MKTRIATAIALTLFLIATTATAAAIGEALVQLDLGNLDSGAEILRAIADDPSADDSSRWEALVRLGVLEQSRERADEALATFRRALTEWAHVPAARAGVVSAVLQQTFERGESVVKAHPGLWKEVSLMTVRPAHGPAFVDVAWPLQQGCQWPPEWSALPLSMQLKDADVTSVLRTVAEMASVPIEVQPCVRGLLVSLDPEGLPLDRLVARAIGLVGLECRVDPTSRAIQIGCPGDTSAHVDVRTLGNEPEMVDVNLITRIESLVGDSAQQVSVFRADDANRVVVRGTSPSMTGVANLLDAIQSDSELARLTSPTLDRIVKNQDGGFTFTISIDIPGSAMEPDNLTRP